jgi:glycosyltransferase involved in cell wall biosynthesis
MDDNAGERSFGSERSFKRWRANIPGKRGTTFVISKLSNRPQSIVFLGSAHDNGGTSILASGLAEAMRKRGHRVEEWYLFGSQGDAPASARIFEAGPRSRSPLVLLRLFVRLIRALRQRKPDVLFGLQPLSNVLVGVAGFLAGIPHRVPTYHGPREWVNRLFVTLDEIAYRLSLYTQMVACANSVARSHDRADMTVVINGHDVPKLVPRAEARAALGLPADGVMLGQIGRLSHQKNQDFSIALLQRLPQAFLVLVGIGPDEAELKAHIAAAGVAGRVHIVPAIAHDRIGLFYSAVDMVLFPSRYEGLSLAAIEAIHAGVPPLCSDIPSFREMFAASPLLAATLLSPTSDPPPWLEHIGKLLEDQDLRRQIVGELARLSPTYSFDAMAEQYLRLIEQWDTPPRKRRARGHPGPRLSPCL